MVYGEGEGTGLESSHRVSFGKVLGVWWVGECGRVSGGKGELGLRLGMEGGGVGVG